MREPERNPGDGRAVLVREGGVLVEADSVRAARAV